MATTGDAGPLYLEPQGTGMGRTLLAALLRRARAAAEQVARSVPSAAPGVAKLVTDPSGHKGQRDELSDVERNRQEPGEGPDNQAADDDGHENGPEHPHPSATSTGGGRVIGVSRRQSGEERPLDRAATGSAGLATLVLVAVA